ncbi:DUF1428 domain-containing protein [Aliiglaciecola litoralis]|uniref:DUF1428 domain-containing protein n=1 Tax=Aliiglaciecola litoralis TaxID=582857 RepID=A0ABP3WQ17_9ALTE
MDYVDGFVLAVAKKNKQQYIQHAEDAGKVFKEHGALSLVECWGDDVPDGKVTSFPMAVKCQDDEVVCFSWIIWPSKEVRDKGMQAAMEDPRFSLENNPIPFDGKRMIFGGFNVIVKM